VPFLEVATHGSNPRGITPPTSCQRPPGRGACRASGAVNAIDKLNGLDTKRSATRSRRATAGQRWMELRKDSTSEYSVGSRSGLLSSMGPATGGSLRHPNQANSEKVGTSLCPG
jgi:hypothetical protein